MTTTAPLLETVQLCKHYRIAPSRLFQRAQRTVALEGVTLSIARGESVAIVGESGSGKSTLLRLLVGLSRASSGEVRFDGRTVEPQHDDLRWLRRRSGMVFQDPYSSFDPRRTIAQTVAEPLIAHGMAAVGSTVTRDRVAAILNRLELPSDAAARYPHEFSGGQRQRIALARALVHGPDVLLADEPVSALDVLVRGRLLELLTELRHELGLTLVTVTHDLSVVPQLAERVLVMRAGRIVESGTTAQIFQDPQQDYTRQLIAALPRLP